MSHDRGIFSSAKRAIVALFSAFAEINETAEEYAKGVHVNAQEFREEQERNLNKFKALPEPPEQKK